MPYSTLEESAESGEPRELYIFTIGQNEYRYTSADEDIVFLNANVQRGSNLAHRVRRNAGTSAQPTNDHGYARL